MSTSSGTPESWISSFCSLLGHEYFAEVSEEFIEDDFNLTGLQNQVAMYKEALEMILDVEPEEDEDEEDEEDEEEEDISGDVRDGPGGRAERRHHSRVASDLSVIESSAEMLYGLIHQRFICSRAGIQQMSEKYELGHFGVCPRTNCNQTRTLPVGLSDIPGEDTVKLFCPSCLDVYVPPNSRFQTVDGAFFGRTFGALFLLTFPEYDLSRSGAETAANLGRSAAEDPGMLNGMYARNIAPGLGRGKIYEPKIYGFRVSEMARSGPRMQWLRNKPDDITTLDEARSFADEHGADSDDDDEDQSMNMVAAAAAAAATTSGGRPTARRRLAGNARLRQRQGQNGSPMAVDANGAESEL
ncbi:casein kinase II regulatory subunit-domain-containing protein [Chaetomidium leptoderma]|uniref:Casein kinase II subunit beta n=1 Tax=Chaetomidium leptoderma TaxID=669021 RepID=A0AAN6ZUI0_9PEZI|nr:casein kinase II regulatory subunit-domain-containing protein [Chaetomidium leptoderma]